MLGFLRQTGSRTRETFASTCLYHRLVLMVQNTLVFVETDLAYPQSAAMIIASN
jgi:hypothetical protein